MAEPRGQKSVCVVTPSFQQGEFIERTILSVLEQGLDGLDYVVIDGGSSDGTVDVLRRFDGRLRWVSEPDDGQADAVNKGLAATDAEIIGWLNSDDVYYPGALAAVRTFLEAHPEVDVVYGEARHIDESDAEIEPYPIEPWDPERLKDVCFLCQPAVFFRRRVVERFGALDERLHFCLDYEYWLRLARNGARFAHLDDVLAGSRLYATNKTLGQRLRVHDEINAMMRRTLGQVPDRWISNYVHAFLEDRGFRREDHPGSFATVAALGSWLAALEWNGSVSRPLWHTTLQWLREALRRAGFACRSARHMPGRNGRHSLPYEDTRGARMRIGFDVSQTGTEKTGCGYLADGLVRALAEIDHHNQYILYPTFGGDYWDREGPGATRRIEASNFRRGLAQPTHREARAFWRLPPEDLETRLGYPDLVHSHNFFCPTGLRRARLVYTLHDLAFLVHPEWTTEHNRQICFEGVYNASLHADLVLANSEFTRRCFLETFPHYPEERTAVASPASRFADRDPALGSQPSSLPQLEPDRFFLSVGTLEPRKNQVRLLEAYARYASASSDPLPLVLAGGRGWMMEDLEERIARQGLAQRVELLGYVDDETLRWLYSHAAAFVYPSLFEGFGMPVVEALSLSAAVVTSRVTSLPEVVGKAALFVDPEDVGEIEGALERLAMNEALREDLRRRAPVQAGRFSWLETARLVIGHYARVLEMEPYREKLSVSLRP